MRRRVFTTRRAAVTAFLVAASTLGLPGGIRAADRDAPVRSGVVSLPQRAVEASSGHAAASRVRLPFRANLISVSVDRSPDDPRAEAWEREALLEVRAARDADWAPLTFNLDEMPDAEEARAGVQRVFTEPLWVGTAEFLDLRFSAVPRGFLRDVRVHLINSKGDAEPRNPVMRFLAAAGAFLWSGPPPAEALSLPVPIVRRSQWGANESWRTEGPGRAPRLKAAIVHHTAGSNSYSCSQGDDVVRSIYRFHARDRGWSDIAYNFLIDRCGGIHEGRWGGIESTIIGGHARGMNRFTTGIALIGDFSTASPPGAMISALKRLLAWKLDVHHVPPIGRVEMESTGSDKLDPGQQIMLNRIAGHRNVQSTGCPGNRLYRLLPSIRSDVASIGGHRSWLLRNENTPGLPDTTFKYGTVGDFPVTGDWDGSGGDTIGVVRADGSRWEWFLRDTNSAGTASYMFSYGNPELGDIPVVGDWNGDGTTGIGIVRPDGPHENWVWLLRNSRSGGVPNYNFQFGRHRTDYPVAGDWDGDVPSPADGVGAVRIDPWDDPLEWYLSNSPDAGPPDASFEYGNSLLDVPATGDWDGDGDDNHGIVRTDADYWRWYLRADETVPEGSPTVSPFRYGSRVFDSAVDGDWDDGGDGPAGSDTVGAFRQP